MGIKNTEKLQRRLLPKYIFTIQKFTKTSLVIKNVVVCFEPEKEISFE